MAVDEDMQKLATIFINIQDVLEDAQLNHLESKAVQRWLADLQDVAYDIDDILDECKTHVAKSKHFPHHYFWKNIFIKRDLGKKMKEATARFEEIDAVRANLPLHVMQFEKPTNFLADPGLGRPMGSNMSEPECIFGRDEDKQKITDILVNHVQGNETVSVLPILGVGGLGKTTLAQMIFNDPHVSEHFNLKMWVSVNDNFDPDFLIKAMIVESGEKVDLDFHQNTDSLYRRIQNLLNKRRFLLVLDDVWSPDQEAWNEMRNVLACGAAGSSIIVTTRHRRVAQMVRMLPIYELEGLSEEHCCTLLKRYTFQRVEEEVKYRNLEFIGKQIVKKCAGVPLAVKALGGILRYKRTERDWNQVKDSELWQLAEKDKEHKILPILKLSYHHLPLKLRQCFAYCGTFEKNFRKSKDDLIYLWMAHGYISSNEEMEAEEVGENILDELIARSLLQIKEDVFLKKVYVTIHEIVHDLAQFLLKNNVHGARLGNSSTAASNCKIRQVNMQAHDYLDISSIKTKYKCLRVLDSCSSKISVLPSELGGLKHLRFLNLSHSNIQSLPDSICNLWNLEVLILNSCSKLVCFPKKMKNLKNLRHLLFDACYSLCETPNRIQELRSLRSLSMFMVGQEVGHRLDELEFLNLGGKLEIVHLERVAYLADVRKANLVKKQNLRTLRLVWTKDTDVVDLREVILEELQLPPNVEDLTIAGFNGKHFPNWMGDQLSLEKLTEINICGGKNLCDCSHLEKLPHLEVLRVGHCASIECLFKSGNGMGTCFPALEEMELDELINLKGFCDKEGQDMCPRLVVLDVSGCPSLILPPLNQLEDLICDRSLNIALLPVLNNLATLGASIGDECIPTERLPNLNTLDVRGAHEKCLTTDWMHGLHSLRTVKISEGSFTCLPKEWLCLNATIEELHISCCNEFTNIPVEIMHLQSLRLLALSFLPRMEFIPDAVQHLSWLEELSLSSLHQLISLPDWLGDLTSLTSLTISGCEKLASLPDSIKGMANLQSITIYWCSLDFERRYAEGKGEEWHKIAHIPNVTIQQSPVCK